MTGRLVPSPDVLARRLDDVVLLVHLDTNRMHTLNATGARIWELLREGLDLGDISAELVGEFDVGPEQARAGVDALVADLRREGLVIEATLEHR